MSAACMHRLANMGVALLVLLAGCRSPTSMHDPLPGRRVPDEVARHIPDYRPHDTRPYEFIWSARLPRHDHLLDFERLLGWRVETADQVTSRIERCRDHQLWGEFVGRWTVASERPEGWAQLIPPHPIVIADPVDTLTLWTYAPEEEGVATSTLVCILRDRHGGTYRIDLGAVGEPGWRLLYARLPEAMRVLDHYPLEVSYFEWMDLPVVQRATLRLDALALFVDALDPIRYAPRPQRPLPLVQGQLLGINTGPGMLSFPVNPSTILPAPSPTSADGVLRFEQESEERFVIRDISHSEPLSFRIDVSEGMSRISVLWEGVETGITLQGLHVMGNARTFGHPLVFRHDRQRVYLEYAEGKIYRLYVNGASLIIDLDYRGRQIAGVRAGPLSISGRYIPLHIPYLQRPEDAVSPVLVALETEQPLFVHLMADLYRSNASTHFLEIDEDTNHSQWNIGALYSPRTDRTLNDVHERFVLSVSGSLLDVLPVIPNPPGENADILVDRFVCDLPVSTELALESVGGATPVPEWFANRLLLTPDTIWREERESRSFRLRTNPHLGGSVRVRQWFEAIASAGGVPALYLNVRELSALNEFWSPDHLLRTPLQAWRAVNPFAFSPKPLFALNWVLAHAGTLQSAYSPGAYWLDRFSQYPPWHHNDYDRRVAGAATLSQTLFADGDLLLSLSRETGVPLVGAAGGARFYAGLLDGLVSLEGEDTSRPYDPVYKLNRIQPLSVVFASPFPEGLFEMDPEDPDSRWAVHARLDRYLADQIAYGNAGRLPHPEKNVASEFCERLFYSLFALQQYYVLQRPARILYASDDGYVSLADAITGGSWRRSFLYVEYPGDVQIWVNGSETQAWSLRVGAADYELPPSGWLATAPDLFAFSGLVEDGHRIDYVESTEYRYLHSRGRPLQFRELESLDGEPVVQRMLAGNEISAQSPQ